ncbi:MarR family winged helix-turn-helix transcriptional regulator [Desulfobaculum bizertense]|uniref:DNA-binding transcriptional regulator, MarR family n=1 Tax=Desulfobaculum bizertense DSM 18034 TaxID=1121442 RepID=A0A1T4WL87_9BACT|nr:MarR family transcriptional regulator [Desulfobaculum bizertense]UIJ37071.1 MarR family transcriptional regulator [Desulfobaculum bizertense]SKA78116.1 DNA-binding transcriptional regulator, MarR family [Desulfobaculum bizertense DSM 18034]
MMSADEKYFLANYPGYVIARTGKAIKFELRRYLREAGIDVTSEQWALLCHLWEQEGRSQKELAELSFKDTANITRMIDVLEGKGIVHREKDPADRRTYKIFLTPKGRALRGEIMPFVMDLADRAFSCLSDDDQRELVRMLNTLCNHILEMRESKI